MNFARYLIAIVALASLAGLMKLVITRRGSSERSGLSTLRKVGSIVLFIVAAEIFILAEMVASYTGLTSPFHDTLIAFLVVNALGVLALLVLWLVSSLM